MALKRYKNRDLIQDDSELIKEKLDNKNLKFIKHYTSPKMSVPAYDKAIDIQTVAIIWKRGDRLSKLAEKYYSNAELWWVIAFFNKKPTEAHFKLGDIVYIPTNLQTILSQIKV